MEPYLSSSVPEHEIFISKQSLTRIGYFRKNVNKTS